MKWRPTIRVETSATPWFLELRFSYDEKLIAALRPIPGARYGGNKAWLFPIEMASELKEIANQHGYDVKGLV